MAIHLSTRLKYYKRQDVQQALVLAAQDREVGIFYGDKDTYGKRPDVLLHPRDVLDFVMKGGTSFHISEERWQNPMGIVTGASRKEQDASRIGWDLIIDIDCKWLEYSQVAAHIIVEKFKNIGIRCHTLKFSGNHGFHIAVPFEAFPQRANVEGQEREVKDLFPEGPRKVAAYLQDEIRGPLGDMLVKRFSLDGIKLTTGKPHAELVKKGPKGPYLDPFCILAIDTILIASRHLVRAPYSLHDKSGLASVPIDPDSVLSFERNMAAPETVVVGKHRFLDRTIARPNEAQLLFDNAFAHNLPSSPLSMDKDAIRKSMRRDEETIPDQALPETLFPPCMTAIQKGMRDGKKRAMFAVVNFLVLAGWDYDKIEEWIVTWNKNNPEPLREVMIKGHVRYHKQVQKKMPPPSCRRFYQDMGVCHPDGLCERIKNPIQYVKRRAFALANDKPQKKAKPKKEAKDAPNKETFSKPEVK